jgi:two-component system, NarL family, sensor kinase
VSTVHSVVAARESGEPDPRTFNPFAGLLVGIRDRSAWPAAGVTVCLAAAGLLLGLMNRHAGGGPDAAQWLRLSLSAAMMTVPAAVLASRRPANVVGWLLLAAGFLLALAGVTTQFGVYAVIHGLPGGRWSLMLARVTALVTVIPPLLLLVFPSGRLASRRWRPVAAAAVLGGVLQAAVGAVDPVPLLGPVTSGSLAHLTSPLAIAGAGALTNSLLTAGIVVTLTSLLLALAGVIVRYRRAAGAERAQLKWFAYAATILVGYLLASPALPSPLDAVVGVAATGFLPVALAVAVLRYRLYDIDLIISKTLVYGALSALVAGLYIGVVVGFGALVRVKSSLALDLLATGLIAAGFAPARSRLQHAVDRLIYRDRPDPYRVLAELGERLAATAVPDEVLPGLAKTVAQALRLPFAAVEMAGPDGGTTLAAYGELTGLRVDLPLSYHGQQVGTLTVGRKNRDELSPAERALLADLGRQAGVAVHAVALTADLRRSRERLVAARQEERSRLRRDLHDGLGPTLAAIGMCADAARRALHSDLPAAEQALAAIRDDARHAVSDVRRIVQNLRLPVLDELGLAGAVRADAERYRPGLDVVVEAPEHLGQLPASTEIAAYRIVSEALANVVKHASARHASIRIARAAGQLELDITDDGIGFHPGRAGAGVGLSTMAERAEELGGTCQVAPGKAGGTSVAVVLPLVAKEAPP